MKRFHAHVAVRDLSQSIVFYSKLFGQSPSVERNDYAKWMLEDLRVNFGGAHGREAKCDDPRVAGGPGVLSESVR